jgi:hypothetical protein
LKGFQGELEGLRAGLESCPEGLEGTARGSRAGFRCQRFSRGLEDAQGIWKFAQKEGFLVTHKNWRVGGSFEVLEGSLEGWSVPREGRRVTLEV